MTSCQQVIRPESVDRLESVCLAIGAPPGARNKGSFPDRLAAAFRALPIPVLGRIEDGQLRLDLRCLEDESGFVGQLSGLRLWNQSVRRRQAAH